MSSLHSVWMDTTTGTVDLYVAPMPGEVSPAVTEHTIWSAQHAAARKEGVSAAAIRLGDVSVQPAVTGESDLSWCPDGVYVFTFDYTATRYVTPQEGALT